MVGVILNSKASLEDADLSRVYSRLGSDIRSGEETWFKKGEKVEAMAKSMLKHRIQSLTGKSIATIEKEIGVSSPPDGPGLDVGSLRKLAHWLILEANGVLPSSPDKKRHKDESENEVIEEGRSTLKRAKKTSSRRSCIGGELLNSSTLSKSRRKTMAPEILLGSKIDCRLEPEDKPTQAMLDVAKKRGSPTKRIEKLQPPIEPKRKPKISFSGAHTLLDGKRNEIYIALGCSFRLTFESLKTEIPPFPGAALAVIHTPEDWMSPEIYLAIDSIVNINRDAGLKRFLILIKCDVDNCSSTKMSLTNRFTEHVQLLYLHCNNPVSGKPKEVHKLRETSQTYFLAYFFPDCEKEGSVLTTKMMRNENSTNLLSAENEEDLENKIVDSFTEPGDWILDLAGAGYSEIVLSAQKTGRFGVVVDEDEKALEDLQEKAVKIANYHDKNFRDVDGDIVTLK